MIQSSLSFHGRQALRPWRPPGEVRGERGVSLEPPCELPTHPPCLGEDVRVSSTQAAPVHLHRSAIPETRFEVRPRCFPKSGLLSICKISFTVCF